MPPEAFFLSVGGAERGQRFCVLHSPVGGRARAAVLYVHPFAEEMNKSRRMASLQARALASAGCAVLQVDLFGCGDSSGDFGDAGWSDWIDDVVAAAAWLRQRHDAPLWLWGLRAGCLVASAAGQRLGTPCDYLFWQPPSSGRPLLQQFLRLRLASELRDGKVAGVTDGLRRELARGASIELAGYAVSAPLAAGLETAVLEPPEPGRRVVWIEVGANDGAELAPASGRTLSRWREAGVRCTSLAVRGPAFWQTSEIEDVPALVDASLAAMDADPRVALAA